MMRRIVFLFLLTLPAARGDEPVAPTRVIRLFNGKDLSGFYTWLGDTKREDPRKVYSVSSGRLRLSGRPQGQFSLEGPVDLALLERHILRSGLGLSGTANWNGILSVDGSRLRIEGRAHGTGGTFRGSPLGSFATWLSYDGTSGLVMRDIEAQALGGSASLALDVPPTKTGRPIHVRGTVPVRDEDAEGRLARAVERALEIPVGCEVVTRDAEVLRRRVQCA